MKRDFTFILDIIDGILESMNSIPDQIKDESIEIKYNAPFRLLNLGNNKPVGLLDFINSLEVSLGKKAIIKFGEMQDGDVPETWADLSLTKKIINYNPRIDINEGLLEFAKWYKAYYKV